MQILEEEMNSGVSGSFLHNVGIKMLPFDRKKYANDIFNVNDIAYVEEDPVAVQLKAINVRLATDNAENAYRLAFAQRQTTLIALLSVLTSVIVAIASVTSVIVSHIDSRSSTDAMVKAIGAFHT